MGSRSPCRLVGFCCSNFALSWFSWTLYVCWLVSFAPLSHLGLLACWRAPYDSIFIVSSVGVQHHPKPWVAQVLIYQLIWPPEESKALTLQKQVRIPCKNLAHCKLICDAWWTGLDCSLSSPFSLLECFEIYGREMEILGFRPNQFVCTSLACHKYRSRRC